MEKAISVIKIAQYKEQALIDKNKILPYESYLFDENLSAKTIKRYVERARRFWSDISYFCNLNIGTITDFQLVNKNHLLIYEQYIRKRMNSNEITKKTAYITLNSVQKFMKFLSQKKICFLEYTIPQEFGSKPSYRRKGRRKEKVLPNYVNLFEKFLINNNYSQTTIQSHKYRLVKFIKDLDTTCGINNLSLENLNEINLEIIIKYENHLLKKIKMNKIKSTTAYACMKTVRLFIRYLNYERLVDYKYDIPEKFVVQPFRENSYISQDIILELINSILNNPSKIRIQNLAILLLFVDSGCRPIEASNIQLSDLDFSERTIKLFCIKSGMRKLTLNKTTINVLKQYLILRKELNPNSEYLFLNSNGEKTNTIFFTQILYRENIKAFGESKITARGLRHTYVTNAIDNNNEFKKISETMGHKHWVSTYYYLHRSKERLLKNTLPYDPLIFLEEDLHGNHKKESI